MRSREEIEADFGGLFNSQIYEMKLVLEVCLDIRELLIKHEAPKKDRDKYWEELKKFL